MLKTDGPRGHWADIDKIVSKSKKQISMLKVLKCVKIIILIDFECRSMSYEDFLDEAKFTLCQHEFDLPVSIVVSNRMIENWYLADIAFLSTKKKYLKDNIKQKNYEGIDGKEELKKLFKAPHQYQETDHGPELFELIREIETSKRSPSFKSFIHDLKGK